MAVSMSPKQKVYQGVLKEIRQFIDNNQLESGDKLPSERELSEKLQAGRSSIREALRALELLGLIETRHGEGTYLSTYRSLQTVELLSSFILQKSVTKGDLFSTKKMLEKEAAKQVFYDLDENDLDRLRSIIDNSELLPYDKHVMFFEYLFDKTKNLLLKKVWQLMERFSFTINKSYYKPSFYEELLQNYMTNQYGLIENLFNGVVLPYED
ncbi:FadR/GntR family transcriptional regulator [Virgibacillus alimentarius]|uniref:GntR family transcriptional repressor for pyruvate dehydrogenase complex n=1 Tax=Virgibacillus alimentarius TaxID=698769 RepID=A0ABS4SC18_9BACI|nr:MULTISPECIES: GntR family transcriptional regulator [Virgibacillus]MBP2258560.1 GntR family transcriptional repressor for pyruvate dehydrogenase complex [Virgibacillus alimentarius]HLR68447.1 GntR family transcriptional regulator [Virgibacillus sp.]